VRYFSDNNSVAVVPRDTYLIVLVITTCVSNSGCNGGDGSGGGGDRVLVVCENDGDDGDNDGDIDVVQLRRAPHRPRWRQVWWPRWRERL
jgi:hypothetical protein